MTITFAVTPGSRLYLESIAEEIITIAKDYVHTKEVGNEDKKVQKV